MIFRRKIVTDAKFNKNKNKLSVCVTIEIQFSASRRNDKT